MPRPQNGHELSTAPADVSACVHQVGQGEEGHPNCGVRNARPALTAAGVNVIATLAAAPKRARAAPLRFGSARSATSAVAAVVNVTYPAACRTRRPKRRTGLDVKLIIAAPTARAAVPNKMTGRLPRLSHRAPVSGRPTKEAIPNAPSTRPICQSGRPAASR